MGKSMGKSMFGKYGDEVEKKRVNMVRDFRLAPTILFVPRKSVAIPPCLRVLGAIERK